MSSPSPEPEQLRALVRQLEALQQHALEVEERFADRVAEAHPSFRRSARNLLHYMALRSYDLRELQDALAPLGLSSLGRAESHTLANLDAVRRLLLGSLGEEPEPAEAPAQVDYLEGQELLEEHAAALFGGPRPAGCAGRIMVTLPSEAADDPALLRVLVEAGMTVARINCAHDDAAAWRRMAEHTRGAARELDRPCRVQVDLAGPKLRTGPLVPGPRVVRIRPVRDLRGRVLHPARVWLAPPGVAPPEEEVVNACLPIEDAHWLKKLRPGERIRFRDARGRKRRLEVVDAVGGGRWAECDRTSCVETGTELRARKRTATVGELPPVEQVLMLRKGDTLIVSASGDPGRPATHDGQGGSHPARIGCSLPEVLQWVEPGQRVKLDDGKIEGVIRAVSREAGEAEVSITRARSRGSPLRADKGINLPDTELRLSGLTEKDRRDLDVAVELADVIGLSFVNTPADVRGLQDELERRGAAELGIMLKIETQHGIEELPWLLLAAMRSRAAGVMIARGDLAVECGWERLAELQEEILWFCEGAHLPVVWATQVLESLAKQGTPSRAEITDAAMANRADCVMLNKGPHIVDAIRTLNDILCRMDGHQHKKSPRLRSLGISLLATPPPASSRRPEPR